MNNRFSCFLFAAMLLACSILARAQTAVVLAPLPQLQLFDQSGRPLAFGCVFTYKVASTNPLSTYTDYTGSVLNPNPVILSAGGSANIWLQAGQAYTFLVKSAGGSNCASGSTLYTVDGIGGGSTVLTTIVVYSSTVTFIDAAQIQLFTLTLTGNATSQPMTFVGVTPPGIIYFQITQDGSGGHSFSWPSNVVGGCAIGLGANQVTTQAFVYNGANATATGPCITGTGPAITAGSIIDSGLTASLPICTDANMQLSSTCTGLIPNSALLHSSLTYNGQTVSLGAAGNVNAGDAAHSLALNEGDGSQLAALALAADNIAVGVSSADPVAKALCTGTLVYNLSTHTLSCQVDQYGNVAGCVSSGGTPCNVTLSWSVNFADTSYVVTCTPLGPVTGNPQGAFWYTGTKSVGSVVITTDNRGTTNSGGFTSFDCHGHHN
jgi:hypothetical protein